MKAEMMLVEDREAGAMSSTSLASEPRRVTRNATTADASASLDLGQQGLTTMVRNPRSNWTSLELTRYLEPLFIYRKTICKTLLLMAIACWVALLVWPRTYVSEGKLQLLVGRESVGLDPSSTTTQTLMMQKTVEEDINSALEILGSRDVAEHVMREIGAEPILSGFLPNEGEPSRISRWVSGLTSMASDAVVSLVNMTGVRDSISDEERAVLWLQKNVSVYAPKKSSTMIISAEAKSAEIAQAIVSSYTKHFIERHVNVATTEGSHRFFDEQASTAESALNELMNHRSSLLQDHKMVSSSSRFGSLTAQQAGIESTIIATEAQIQQTESELVDLTERIEELELETVSGKQIAPDGTISGMRLALHSLELEEQSLSLKYNEGHWKLTQIKERVAAARKELEKLEQESESLSTAPNPIRLKLEEDILRTKSRLVGLQSLLHESQQQLSAKHEEINDLLELDVRLDSLDREIEVAKKNLGSLREKQEQSRVVEDLRQQRISSVGIAQNASLAHKPASPNKLLIVAGFVALSGGLCLALVGIKEFSRKAFRYSEELERFAGYPVLADVPRVRKFAKNVVRQTNSAANENDAVRSACEIVQSEVWLSDECNSSRGNRGLKLAVVGIDDGVGASLIAITLANLHSERSYAKTMIIDLDRKNATVAKAFGAGQNQSSIRLFTMTPSGTADEFNTETTSAAEPDSSSRTVAVNNHSEELAMIKNLQAAAGESQFVVVDCPPMSRPGATFSVLSQMDQVLLVVQAEKSSTEAVARAIRQIERAGGNIVGLVLNQTESHVPNWIRKLLG